MRGAFDTLQLLPPEKPKGFRQKLKTDLMKTPFSSDREDTSARFEHLDIRFAKERLTRGFQSVIDVL